MQKRRAKTKAMKSQTRKKAKATKPVARAAAPVPSVSCALPTPLAPPKAAPSVSSSQQAKTIIPRTYAWMRHDFQAEQPVNDHELTSLTALIMYVAHVTRQHQFRIERQFADRFNIPNVKCLPSDNYEAAIRYLVDQVPSESSAIA